MSTQTIDALERMLEETEDADDVLRAAVALVTAEHDIVWAGIAFLDTGAVTPGPSAGTPDEARRTSVPIEYQGTPVGRLMADGAPARALLEQVAARIGPYVLIGWDTGGEVWEP